MNKKLKPCPFCGGEADLINDYLYEKWYAGCHNGKCAVQPDTYIHGTPDSAIKAWNTRANIQEAQS